MIRREPPTPDRWDAGRSGPLDRPQPIGDLPEHVYLRPILCDSWRNAVRESFLQAHLPRMKESPPRYRVFLAELKRRGVFKVAALYGAVAFGVLQGADIIFPSLGLPDQALTIVVVLALLGFPVAVALAWIYELTAQGVKRDEPAEVEELEEIARQPRGKRWIAGVMALVFVLLMVGTGWWMLARTPGSEGPSGARGPSSPARVVVLPFSVRSSGEQAYLGEGMVDLLSRRLEVAGELRSVDPRAVLALEGREDGAAPGPERGRAVSRQLAADYFVLGAVVEAGGRLQLDASIYDARVAREAEAEATVEGSAEEVFGLVDGLAAQLLLGTGAGRGGPVARIASVTTDSLSALKEYLRGERALRGGRYLEAAEAFQRAVAIDSAFALSWYRLSVAYEWLTRDDQVAEAAEQAYQHSGRLSERDRRLFEATVAARRGDHARAEQLYRSIVGSYPNDVEAWFQLGEVLFHYGPPEGRSIAASREAFQRVLFYEPDHVNALVHLARIPAVEGNVQELDSLVSRFLAVSPDADRAVELRALRAFASGSEAETSAVLADLRRAPDPALLVTVSFVPVMTLDFEAGFTLSELLTDQTRAPRIRALGHIYRGYLNAGQGRLQDAAMEMAAAERLDSYRATEFGSFLLALPFFPVGEDELSSMLLRLQALDPDGAAPSMHPSAFVRGHEEVHRHVRAFLAGLLAARLGQDSLAQGYADLLEKMESPEKAPSLAEDLALGVEAYARWLNGQGETGLALLEAAARHSFYQNALVSPIYSGALQRYLRAVLLEEEGREREAIRWYGSFEQISVYDLVFLAPSHLRRAEAFLSLDDVDQARTHYARFIDLWSGCDPELRPMVERARERLIQLSQGR